MLTEDGVLYLSHTDEALETIAESGVVAEDGLELEVIDRDAYRASA